MPRFTYDVGFTSRRLLTYIWHQRKGSVEAVQGGSRPRHSKEMTRHGILLELSYILILPMGVLFIVRRCHLST
jgi:hypothetical protein